MDITPHLAFNGDCAEAFAFYAEVFSGEITFMMTHGESPMKDQMPVEWHPLIIHATLKVDGGHIMGADAPPHVHSKPSGTSVNITLQDLDQAKAIFKALVHGGSETMAFGETFWAKGFGMCVDRFGQHWMINCGELM